MAPRSKCINLWVQHKGQHRRHLQQLRIQGSPLNLENVCPLWLKFRKFTVCIPNRKYFKSLVQNSCQNKWIEETKSEQDAIVRDIYLYIYIHIWILCIFFWLPVCVGQWSHKSKTKNEVCGWFEIRRQCANTYLHSNRIAFVWGHNWITTVNRIGHRAG